MSNSNSNGSTINGTCSDCGEKIPHNMADGGSCENCGHVFYENNVQEKGFFVVLNTISGTKIVVLGCDSGEFLKAEQNKFGDGGLKSLDDIKLFEFDILGSIEVYDEINDYVDLVDIVDRSSHLSEFMIHLNGDKSWVCYYIES